MQLKNNKRNVTRSVLLCLVLGILLIAIPEVSHAWSPAPPTDALNACEADGGEYKGFTRRIVLCVQNTVLAAVYELLAPLFSAFLAAASACMTVAVGIWGLQLAAGHRPWIARQGIVLAIKIMIVTTLFGGASYNFLFFYSASLDVLDDILSAVTGYVSLSPTLSCDIDPPANSALAVWDRVDCALNTIIGGIFTDSDVTIGVGGFLLAALLAGGPGIFVALLLVLVVVQVLFAVIRALYIYILAYVSFSLMALVAPLFLPMILFRVTQGYFEKWLKLSIGFLMQPIFLFVYLVMLLSAYDSVVYTGNNSLFNVLTKDNFKSCTTPSCSNEDGCKLDGCTPVGEWLKTANIYVDEDRGDISVGTNAGKTTGNQSCTTGPAPVCSGDDIIKDEAGTANKLAEVPTTASNWAPSAYLQQSLYNSLGIEDYFFHVNIPVTAVDWKKLAEANGEPDVQKYLVKLFLSLFLAAITTYIFLLLLDMLPFIGSGITNIGSFIAGGGLSGFGFGNLAPPGEGMINNLRKKMSG